MRILVLGTSSAAGKTMLCAMLCRHFMREGKDPAPFKASNLSLNSYATKDGGEIGMGQAFQAWSAGLEPVTDMNPVLLKPSGGGMMQAVVNGKPYMDYGKGKELDREAVMEEALKAFGRLSESHRFIICEGSGSPAEINLMDRDLANTGLMERTGIPAIIVGDIERGGVFAAIYGTWRLIPEDIRPLLKGFVINRFRGDASILKSALDRIEELTGMRCLGVLPYMHLRFPEEDSCSDSEGKLEGATVREAYLSNIDEFTDAAEASGFDFAAVEEIARLRSSARCDSYGRDFGSVRDFRIHRDRFSFYEEDIRAGTDADRFRGILHGYAGRYLR